jgi:hypothetical protein
LKAETGGTSRPRVLRILGPEICSKISGFNNVKVRNHETAALPGNETAASPEARSIRFRRVFNGLAAVNGRLLAGFVATAALTHSAPFGRMDPATYRERSSARHYVTFGANERMSGGMRRNHQYRL